MVNIGVSIVPCNLIPSTKIITLLPKSSKTLIYPEKKELSSIIGDWSSIKEIETSVRGHHAIKTSKNNFHDEDD